MSKQIKITNCNLFQTKSYKLTNGTESMSSILDKLILYSFLNFLEESTVFVNGKERIVEQFRRPRVELLL